MTLIGHHIFDIDTALCHDCFIDYQAERPACSQVEIHEDTEVDSPTHCGHCETLINHALTPDGVAYVAEAIQDHITSRFETPASVSGRACILRQWWEEYGAEEFTGHPLLQLMLHDYFTSVPTVDKHSPVFAREMAAVHGMVTCRHAVVTGNKAIGPFVSLTAAAAAANLSKQDAVVMPMYSPGEEN